MINGNDGARIVWLKYCTAPQLRVPYYRDQWADRRRRGDRSSWDVLDNWPLLEKEAIRVNPEAFVADDRDIRSLVPGSTSGTTFKPLRLWSGKETLREWYALHEVRCRGWYGQTRNDRWAHFVRGGLRPRPNAVPRSGFGTRHSNNSTCRHTILPRTFCLTTWMR